MFIDSIFRGYRIPTFYFHKKQRSAGTITNTYFDIVDGQQRIDAIYSYNEGAFALLDPASQSGFRFPNFVKEEICNWGGKRFGQLSEDLKNELRLLYIGTSKNALLGIFRDGNEKCRFSVSFIFNHLRD